jgi:hypothetical protein
MEHKFDIRFCERESFIVDELGKVTGHVFQCNICILFESKHIFKLKSILWGIRVGVGYLDQVFMADFP